MSNLTQKNKTLYPINCKKCKKYISAIQVSSDLLEEVGPTDLNLDNIFCNSCGRKDYNHVEIK